MFTLNTYVLTSLAYIDLHWERGFAEGKVYLAPPWEVRGGEGRWRCQHGVCLSQWSSPNVAMNSSSPPGCTWHSVGLTGWAPFTSFESGLACDLLWPGECGRSDIMGLWATSLRDRSASAFFFSENSGLETSYHVVRRTNLLYSK